MIKTTDDIKSLGTILGVWAHPDDETFSMGGIMAAAVKNGQTVAFVTATRGEKGVQDESRWPAARLGEIRTGELAEAMRILGVTNHEWLDFPDGKCGEVEERMAIDQIIKLIEKYQPDSILTFGPEGMTGHPDHQAVSRWTAAAHKACGSKAALYYATLTPKQYEASKEANDSLNMFFNISKPPVCPEGDCAICFELGEELCTKKLAALKAMPSQYESMAPFFEQSLKISFGTEAFKKANDA